MSWQTVARKDIREATSPRVVRLLAGLFVLISAGIAYALPLLLSQGQGEGESAELTASSTEFASMVVAWPPMTILLPLLAILLGYKTVAAERESGTLVLLLALPHSRRDVFAGKYLGRATVLAVTVAVAFALAGWLVAYPYGSVSLVNHVALTVLTLLLGAVFLGIAMALSVLSRTELRATLSSVGVFVLFTMLWGPLRAGARGVLTEAGVLEDGFADPVLFLYSLEPTTLYGRVGELFLGDGTDPVFGSTVPWYGSEWLALALFLAWVVVPPALAYWRFEGVEL
jgi:ABC-2 type transport system permease protein